DLVRAALAEGADAIELGVPFSDPMADGPVLQRSAARALAAGTTLPRILELVAKLRSESAQPIILFGYYNPFFRYGVERIAADAAAAGADGFLCVGLPSGEAGDLRSGGRGGVADAAIVGSALARLVEEGEREASARVAGFLGGLRRAIGAAAAARTA